MRIVHVEHIIHAAVGRAHLQRIKIYVPEFFYILKSSINSFFSAILRDAAGSRFDVVSLSELRYHLPRFARRYRAKRNKQNRDIIPSVRLMISQFVFIEGTGMLPGSVFVFAKEMTAVGFK